MNAQPLSVLFPCTGNSARNIMAERLVERCGGGLTRGFSPAIPSHPVSDIVGFDGPALRPPESETIPPGALIEFPPFDL